MNYALAGIMLAVTNEEVATGILAGVGATFYVIAWIVGLIFSIMLIIAPLRIWSWTKRTCGEAEEIRRLLRIMDADRKKEEKRKAQYLAAIEKRLENVENALYPNDGQQDQ